jgi:hypothetical protein
MIANYNELVDKLETWLRRDNLAPDIPTLIRFGEQQLMFQLKVPEMILRTFVGLGAGSDTVALPTNFLAIRSLSNGDIVMRNKTTANMMRDDDGVTSGIPLDYSINGSNLLVRPIANGTVSLLLEYWGFPAFLSSNNQTNSILTKYPSLYLYSALTFGYDLVRHSDQLKSAMFHYNTQLGLANNMANYMLNGNPQASPQSNKRRYIP